MATSRHIRMEEDRERPLYLISVVAETLHVHPQTLRMYEREGFVVPRRTGGQRLYSRADVERLQLILELTRNLGVNRAGVEIVLRMRTRLEALQSAMAEVLAQLGQEEREVFRDRVRRIFEDDKEVL